MENPVSTSTTTEDAPVPLRTTHPPEERLGTLKRGAWADIAVLSGNPLTTAPEALSALSVEMTLLAGQVVYER